MAILQTNDIFKTELSEGQHRLSPEEIHKVQQVVYGITIDITELCSELNIPICLPGEPLLEPSGMGDLFPGMMTWIWLIERNILNCLLDDD